MSEWLKQRVREFSASGALIRTFDEKGSGNGKSDLPWGIAAEPSTGDLYVTEAGNDRVQKFNAEGGFIAAFGSAGQGSGELSLPKGVAVSASGQIYIADTGNNRVEESGGVGPTNRNRRPINSRSD